ncbi:hypothetical protein, partial [Aliivibrio fischeri]|uniref:AbiU2 domain-containing protein n=1 Tax=Aliivibrio fischeri TaxID=668 RepID=UPI001C01335A
VLLRRYVYGKVMSKMEKTLMDIEDSLLKAEASYQLWWAIVGQGMSQHRNALDKLDHVDFFHASIPIFLQSMFLNLSKIFDRAEDLSGMRSLKKSLLENGKDETIHKIDCILDRNKNYIISIKGIRDQSIGHRKTHKTVEQIYNENEITPDQIKLLIEDIKTIVKIASGTIGRKYDLLDSNRYADATISLIKSIE